MSEPKFFQTRMGHRFYETTVPELVRQITRLNELLERLVERKGQGAVESDDASS